MDITFCFMNLKQIFSGLVFSWQQLSKKCFKTLIWHLIKKFTTDVKSFDSQKMFFVLVWFKYFLLLKPLNVENRYLGCKFFKCFMCYLLLRRFPSTKMTREKKKNIFWLIKNEDKIVGGLLKLNFYYITKKQKMVVMYLEVIFTGIKTERWKATGIKACRKDYLHRD